MYYRVNMSQKPPVASSKEKISSKKHNVAFKLREASFLNGEHDAFKAHLESNPISPKWFSQSMHRGIQLVTNKMRTITDMAPILMILLKYGAEKNFYYHKTPYHTICLKKGDYDEILEFAIKGLGPSLINAKLKHYGTALMCAIQNANINCVKTLITHGADVNLISDIWYQQELIEDSVTPLIATINLLNADYLYPDIMMKIFDVLLDSGADVNQPCRRYQRTPIMYAAELGNTNCVQKLIRKGACLYTEDKYGRTGWTLGVSTGCVDMLKCLLKDGGIDKNCIDRYGFSVLYRALESRKIQAVQYLLKLGVTITTDIPRECVDLSQFCGTNLQYHLIFCNQLLFDPYMKAISMDMPRALQLMEKNECQLYKCAEALIYAICSNSVKVVDYLLCTHNYPLNIEYTEECAEEKWSRPHTLLTEACQGRSVKIVKLLLEHGADPSIQNNRSNLIAAICHKHVEVITLFIRSGVNLNARSFHPFIENALPFEVAVHKSHIYAAEMLLVCGCSCGVYSLDKHEADISHDLQKLLKEWNIHKNKVIPRKQRCRMVILNHLSPQADKKINELPLPQLLIRYLSIPELDDIIEACRSSPHTNEYVK